MPSPSDKAKDDFAYFLSRVREHQGGDAADALAFHFASRVFAETTVAPASDRQSSDLVLDRAADGTFCLPPKHDFERDGPLYICWDFGAGDDASVIAFFDGEQWTSEEIERIKGARS